VPSEYVSSGSIVTVYTFHIPNPALSDRRFFSESAQRPRGYSSVPRRRSIGYFFQNKMRQRATIVFFALAGVVLVACRREEAGGPLHTSLLTPEETVARCYELTVGEWKAAPDGGGDLTEATVPRRIELQPPTRDRAFGRVHVPQLGIYGRGLWVRRGQDTLIQLGDGFYGVSLSLNPDGGGLRGLASLYCDYRCSSQTAQVEARSIDCQGGAAVDERPESLNTNDIERQLISASLAACLQPQGLWAVWKRKPLHMIHMEWIISNDGRASGAHSTDAGYQGSVTEKCLVTLIESVVFQAFTGPTMTTSLAFPVESELPRDTRP
jgi:hypothetical protein